MKQTLSVLLVAIMLFSLCACQHPDAPYIAKTEIDHCVVEPDDKLNMSDSDVRYYEKLMNAMLSRKDSVKLSKDSLKNEYYIDLLKQSPYFFFVKDYKLSDGIVTFSYAYEKSQQDEMLSFIDEAFLNIINTHANKDDNTLDSILNVHLAVTHLLTYDHEREDNKQLDSPLFKYPADEIYKAFKDRKSLCYGFAYTIRFALLQLDIDCFCVYGPCSAHEQGHMWNIFKIDNEFYTCDAAWDRSDDGYAQLYHFGKTDKEREADTLTRTAFSSTFFENYGEIECVDETFSIFRSIERYSYSKPHTYFLEDYKGKEYLFNTETMTLK